MARDSPVVAVRRGVSRPDENANISSRERNLVKDGDIRVYGEVNYRADYARAVTAAAMPIVVTLTVTVVRLGSRYGAVAPITEIREPPVSRNSHVDANDSSARNVLCILTCLRLRTTITRIANHYGARCARSEPDVVEIRAL